MGSQSSIQWTDATWNPLHGCSRVSEGCRNCYAERVSRRLREWKDLVHLVGDEWRWTGNVTLNESALRLPLSWRKPRRIFVNSMSDLFHERVPDEWIDRVFAVMALTQRHTYQILTKRPARMLAYLTGVGQTWAVLGQMNALLGPKIPRGVDMDGSSNLPLPNVWLGVSVEDQATADERIPLLLQTPAALRFVSYEPALGPVDFTNVIHAGLVAINALTRPVLVGCPIPHEPDKKGRDGLDWIIVGGESGPGARPFDLAWARETIRQARNSSVPVSVFVKQLGARIRATASDAAAFPTIHHWLKRDGTMGFLAPLIGPNIHKHPSAPGWEDADFRLCDRKGGDWNEWPKDLRVREFPA